MSNIFVLKKDLLLENYSYLNTGRGRGPNHYIYTIKIIDNRSKLSKNELNKILEEYLKKVKEKQTENVFFSE